MKKYSMELVQGMPKKGVAQEKIEEYRDMLIIELKKLGASDRQWEIPYGKANGRRNRCHTVYIRKDSKTPQYPGRHPYLYREKP